MKTSQAHQHAERERTPGRAAACGPSRGSKAAAFERSPRMQAQHDAIDTMFAPVQRTGVMQRMVVAATPVSEIDRIIAADVAFQSRRAGGVTVDLRALDAEEVGTYSIASSEWMVVCGHGDTSGIDRVGPAALSRSLKRVTNHQSAGGVYLSACNSASLDSQGSSFLKRFHADFAGRRTGPEPRIVGATGYKINDFDAVSGEEQVAVPTTEEAAAGNLQHKNWSASGIGGDIRDSIGASSIAEVLAQGQALLANKPFRQFFSNFVGDLKKANLLEPDQLIDQKGRSIDLR